MFRMGLFLIAAALILGIAGTDAEELGVLVVLGVTAMAVGHWKGGS